MTWGKRQDVLDWMTKVDVEELDISDQLRVVMAFENLIDDLKPIMEK